MSNHVANNSESDICLPADVKKGTVVKRKTSICGLQHHHHGNTTALKCWGKNSNIQQLIHCLSVAVSALWSNRIFSFLTCWCERPSKNCLSCPEEKGRFFSPGRAPSEPFLMLSCACRWSRNYLVCALTDCQRWSRSLPGSSRPARGAQRGQTWTGLCPAPRPSRCARRKMDTHQDPS